MNHGVHWLVTPGCVSCVRLCHVVELTLTDAAGWDQAQADIATTQEN